MKRIIQWSIDHQWIVIGLSVLLFAAGAWTARQMPIDVFPDLTAPTVTILPRPRDGARGDGVAGHVPDRERHQRRLRRAARALRDGRRHRRRLGRVRLGHRHLHGAPARRPRSWRSSSGALPPQVERPVLAPVSSIMGEILFFAISSERDDPLTLRTIADTTVRRRLLAVPGVSQVTPIGGAERQFQVIAHPGGAARQRRLADRAARRGARREPEHLGRHLHRGRAGVRARGGRARAERRRTSARPWWRCAAIGPVLVRDVADVREGAAFKRGEGSRSGKPAVIVGVQKQPGANTIEVTARLDRELDTLQQELPRGHDDRPPHLPAGGLHRGGGRQRDHGAARRRHARGRRSCCCSSPTCAPRPSR